MGMRGRICDLVTTGLRPGIPAFFELLHHCPSRPVGNEVLPGFRLVRKRLYIFHLLSLRLTVLPRRDWIYVDP